MDFYHAVVSIGQRISDLIQNIGNVFVQIFSSFMTIFNYIYKILEFIINTVILLFKYIYRVFDAIFSDGFFQTIRTGLNGLEIYIGTFWTNILIVLVVIVFLLILFGFILRLMKGQLHYYNTGGGIKYWKKHGGK